MQTALDLKEAYWLNKYRQDIELEPFFQRGTVWPDSKQQYFIDSIIQNWGTPKIFLWKSAEDSFQCLDGKQRLTSLFRFMADEIPVPKYTKSFAGKKYSELPKTVQDSIDKYKFAVEVITDATEDEVVELFKRLQAGVTLNFGEKLFARPGKMNDFVKKTISPKKFFTKIVSLPNTRYSHYATCAQLCLLSVKGGSEDLKLKNLEGFFAKYASFDTSSAEAKKITNTIDQLEKAFVDKNISLKNRASIVSVFYLFQDLSARGSIKGREKEIGKFFYKFTKDILQEFNKDPADRDPAVVSYQSAVTQGADKIKSIKMRHGILLKKLANKNRFFYNLLHPSTPEEDFKSLYEKARVLTKSKNSKEFEAWLKSNKGLKQAVCQNARGDETYIGHIRHSIHHSKHGSFLLKNLSKGARVLSKIVKDFS